MIGRALCLFPVAKHRIFRQALAWARIIKHPLVLPVTMGSTSRRANHRKACIWFRRADRQQSKGSGRFVSLIGVGPLPGTVFGFQDNALIFDAAGEMFMGDFPDAIDPAPSMG